MTSKPLAKQITNFDFYPEIYVYPSPRTYSPVSEFNFDNIEFTQDINVYVHIPFCKQICTYCGYLKVVDSKGTLISQYVDALIKEMYMYKDILQNANIKTLHFGGGTPSLLSSFELASIMTTLVNINPNILNTADEISIETTPELVELKKFSEYKNLGINRVSMGLQTLIDDEIKLCKRHNSSAISLRAIETLRKVGISNIVIDLMIGIEGQTLKSFEESVRILLKYKPETVELYAVGLMPNTLLGIKKSSLKNMMTTKEIYQCHDIGRELFLNSGYEQDCHNRYIIPNKGSFFQEDYVFAGLSLIGFGAGARTYAKSVHYRNNYYSKNHMNSIVEYIDDVKSNILPVKSATFLNSDEKMRQYIIYNIESLNKKEFKRNFNISLREQFPALYSELIELNLAQEDWQRIWLTTKGLSFRDLICQQIFSDKVKQIEEEYRPK
ncbi:MAG: coproporphyrinogen-III oxidase family protein [Candidatus Woesearchaeota archaeon]|jgi:oxygen-independent coproporphyrinogen-3 oxidase